MLVHAFPRADIPVIQLSVNGSEGFDDHFDLGVRLAPLRSQGILVLGSGNVVHNLGLLDPRAGQPTFDWAVRFDQACTASMVEEPEGTRALVDHPDYRRAAPTPDHFLPLAPVAGIAAASEPRPSAGRRLRREIAVDDRLPGRLIPPTGTGRAPGPRAIRPGREALP